MKIEQTECSEMSAHKIQTEKIQLNSLLHTKTAIFASKLLS